MAHKIRWALPLIAGALFSAAAGASTVYGSAAQLTARDCSAISASTDCVVAASPRVQNLFLGGVGSSLDTTLSNGHGSWSVTTGANAGGLPVLKGGSWSGAGSRINTNAVVFQQFTFTGAAHTRFSLVGDLTFDSTGNDGLSSTGFDGNRGEQAGEAGIYATLYFMDVAAFAGVTSAPDIMSLLSMDCSNAAMFAKSEFSPAGALAAGAQSGRLTLGQNCTGADMYLDPGDTFVMVMALQTPSNRGGFMDATHTFVSRFDPDLPPDVVLALQNGLVPRSPADLPEPASVTLALGALAALALARRRARRGDAR